MEKAGVDTSYNLHSKKRKNSLPGKKRRSVTSFNPPPVHDREPEKREDSLPGKKRRPEPSFSTRRNSSPVHQRKPEKTIEEDWEERFYSANHSVDSLTEIFKTLRARILLTKKRNTSAGTIMVTSAMPGEGKSFVAANLSLAFASGLDQYVLLVDGDLRRPSIKKLFGRDEDFGLVNYLEHQTALPKLIVRSRKPKLSLLLAGKPPSNPSELLGSILMKDLIAELSSRYTDRTIIFDAPPVLLTAEARTLAHHVDGVVMVVRQGIVGKAKIEETINAIGPERILGIVFNDHHGAYFSKSSKYGYGYGYNYRYE